MADNKQLVRRHFEETWNQGRFEGLETLYAKDYQGEVPLVGKVDLAHLRGVVGTFRKAFPDLRFEVQDIIQEGDRCAVRWQATGTSRGEFMGIPPTGKLGTVAGLSLIDVQNGRIARDTAQMDVIAFLQQAGLSLPLQPGAMAGAGAAASTSTRPEARH